MAYPAFDLREKYRAIQSSALGTISIQGGYVFDEGGNLIGQAPEWGPDLFLKNGQPTDPYQVVRGYAEKNPYRGPSIKDPAHALGVEQSAPPRVTAPVPTDKKDEIDEVFETGVIEEKKPMPEKARGRKKGTRGSRYGSGTF